jgi:hypothetical protein
MCGLQEFLLAADSLVLVKKIPMKALLFTTDKTGTVYVGTQNNAVLRFNENGDSTGVYYAIRKGKITQLDATNPMQLLVFYADVPQLTVLNRMMAVVENMDLKQVGIYNCPAISYSADGLTWAYNSVQAELVKVDFDKKTSTKSFNFLQQFQQNVQPVFITEQERNLFVLDTNLGILKFDQFGTYITTYHFTPKEVQYINGYLVFYKNGELLSYQLQTLQERKIQLPEAESILQARIEKNRLYILRKDALEIYDKVQK